MINFYTINNVNIQKDNASIATGSLKLTDVVSNEDILEQILTVNKDGKSSLELTISRDSYSVLSSINNATILSFNFLNKTYIQKIVNIVMDDDNVKINTIDYNVSLFQNIYYRHNEINYDLIQKVNNLTDQDGNDVDHYIDKNGNYKSRVLIQNKDIIFKDIINEVIPNPLTRVFEYNQDVYNLKLSQSDLSSNTDDTATVYDFINNVLEKYNYYMSNTYQLVQNKDNNFELVNVIDFKTIESDDSNDNDSNLNARVRIGKQDVLTTEDTIDYNDVVYGINAFGNIKQNDEANNLASKTKSKIYRFTGLQQKSNLIDMQAPLLAVPSPERLSETDIPDGMYIKPPANYTKDIITASYTGAQNAISENQQENTNEDSRSTTNDNIVFDSAYDIYKNDSFDYNAVANNYHLLTGRGAISNNTYISNDYKIYYVSVDDITNLTITDFNNINIMLHAHAHNINLDGVNNSYTIYQEDNNQDKYKILYRFMGVIPTLLTNKNGELAQDPDKMTAIFIEYMSNLKDDDSPVVLDEDRLNTPITNNGYRINSTIYKDGVEYYSLFGQSLQGNNERPAGFLAATMNKSDVVVQRTFNNIDVNLYDKGIKANFYSINNNLTDNKNITMPDDNVLPITIPNKLGKDYSDVEKQKYNIKQVFNAENLFSLEHTDSNRTDLGIDHKYQCLKLKDTAINNYNSIYQNGNNDADSNMAILSPIIKTVNFDVSSIDDFYYQCKDYLLNNSSPILSIKCNIDISNYIDQVNVGERIMIAHYSPMMEQHTIKPIIKTIKYNCLNIKDSTVELDDYKVKTK